MIKITLFCELHFLSLLFLFVLFCFCFCFVFLSQTGKRWSHWIAGNCWERWSEGLITALVVNIF